MLLAEVGKLLAVIASFDNRRLDEATAFSWKLMLDREVPDATLEQATEVVLDWFATANPYFEVRHLADGLKRKLRLTAKQIADDVRSAKARGLIDASHDPRTPLPGEVVVRLAEARAADRDVAPGEIEAGVGKFALDVGRRL